MSEGDWPTHGIESAFYSNGPSGLVPVLVCICGFETSRGCRNWQEAGEELDTHLGEASR